jgi:putative hemolysin
MLEELVGEIGDEYDEADASIVRREDGSYLVDGLLPLSDLEEQLNIPEVEKLGREYSFETAAGLLLILLGHIPTPGESARWQDYTFEVVDMDEHRIDKILILPPRPEAVQSPPHSPHSYRP